LDANERDPTGAIISPFFLPRPKVGFFFLCQRQQMLFFYNFLLLKKESVFVPISQEHEGAKTNVDEDEVHHIFTLDR